MGKRYYHLQNWNFSASLDGENERWGMAEEEEIKRAENMWREGFRDEGGGYGTFIVCHVSYISSSITSIKCFRKQYCLVGEMPIK
jgi:hypothetical protein